jgi:hypothetical protein
MTSYAAAKWKYKGPILVASMVPVVVGLAILYVEGTSSHFRQPVALAGYYLLAFLFGGNPLIVSWMVANTAGQTKKSAVMSLYNNCGSAVGNTPPLQRQVQAALYPRSPSHPGRLLRSDGSHYYPVLGPLLSQQGPAEAACRHGKPKHIVDPSMTDKYHAYCAADETLGQNDDEFVYVY